MEVITISTMRGHRSDRLDLIREVCMGSSVRVEDFYKIRNQRREKRSNEKV